MCMGSENGLVAEDKSELKALVMPSPIKLIVCGLGAGAV